MLSVCFVRHHSNTMSTTGQNIMFLDQREKDRFKEALFENEEGLKLYKQVDFDEAIIRYTKALTLAPQLPAAYYNRGTVHYRLGDYDLAVADLERALVLDPDNAEFRQGLEECRRVINKSDIKNS